MMRSRSRALHAGQSTAGLAGVVKRGLVALVAVATMLAVAPPARSGIRVVDDDGQAIVLAQPARRIISLGPHVTELLFAAGAGDRIIGTIAYSDYPPAALAIPRIGDSFIIDLERVLGLKPDLIIVWLHGNAEGQLEKLRRLGIPVFSSEPRRLDDIASTLRRFGVLTGSGPHAESAAVAFEQRVALLRARHAGRPPVRVFYQISERPLLTVNRDHLISDVLRTCGATNVFANLKPLVPSVNTEAVMQADPEAIVTAGGESGNATGFVTWSRLSSLQATRRQNFILLDSDTISRQSDRILDGATKLCAALEGVRAKRR